MRALPGVDAAGVSSYLPFSWDGSSSVIIPEGYVAEPGESVVSPNQLYVSPGYLEAMRVRARSAADCSPTADVRTRRGSSSSTSGSRRDSGRTRIQSAGRMYLPDRPEDVARPGPT